MLLLSGRSSRTPGEPDDKVYSTLKEIEDAGHKVRCGKVSCPRHQFQQYDQCGHLPLFIAVQVADFTKHAATDLTKKVSVPNGLPCRERRDHPRPLCHATGVHHAVPRGSRLMKVLKNLKPALCVARSCLAAAEAAAAAVRRTHSASTASPRACPAGGLRSTPASWSLTSAQAASRRAALRCLPFFAA